MALSAVQLIFLLLVPGVIIIAVFYLKNLQDLLNECSARNQQVPPSNVWLMFIPIFNIIYPFILYPKITESIKREFEDRKSPQQGDYLKGIGIAMPVLNVCGFIPVIGGIAGLANIILFIIYWIRSSEFKNQLRMLPKAAGSLNISDNPDILD